MGAHQDVLICRVFLRCLDALQYLRFLWNTTVIWRIVQELHISTKTSKPGLADFWKKNELGAFSESLRPSLSIACPIMAMAMALIQGQSF